MRFLYSGLPDHKAYFVLRRYRTKRGWHVELYSNLYLKPAESVALQAILGSDFKREAFNLFRAHRLSLAPAFWRALPRWNILHARKLTDGTARQA